MENLFKIKNKRVVITGGLGLIGMRLAEVLSSRGAAVIIIDIDNFAKAKNKIKKISNGSNVYYFKADITDKKQLISVRSKILKKLNGIDVLINGAAITHKVEHLPAKIKKDYSFEALDLKDWNRELDVNLTGTMLACQVFGSVMRSGSSIINISSIYGITAPDQSIYSGGYKQPMSYSVSKAGVVMLTKYLASYWGDKNIRVNCLAPGGIKNSQSPDFIKKYSKKTPLGRMAELKDLDGAVLFLCSGASSYCTGLVLNIDGGWTIW